MRDRRTDLLTGAIAGLLAAALVTAVLVTSGKLTVTTAGPSTTAIVLPQELLGMNDYLTGYAASGRSSAEITAEAARIGRTYQRTADAYRAAFNGAATSVKRYGSADLAVQFTIVAVRTDSSPLLAGVLDDPADLGLIAQPLEVRQFGEVSCLVRRFMHGPGTLDALDQETDQCHRRGPNASVWLFVQGADHGTTQQTAIDVTNAAFEATTAT